MNARLENEERRMREELARRAAEVPGDFYSLHRPANLFIRHSQERALRAALDRHDLLPLRGRRVLEVGCGTGAWMSVFQDLGARESDLSGVDLDEERLQSARDRYPDADLRTANGTELPFDDGTFDLVFQSTVFTSILDEETRRQVAFEMLRVLKPRGIIAWYDFAYDNPKNQNVKGIAARAIEELFPGCSVELRRTTLAPPLARRLVPLSWTLATVLQSVRLLNTHLMATIRPRG